jgi:hypothetical protein
MKCCAACREEKDEGEFNRKGDKLQGKCRSCQRAYHQFYYRKNKSRFIEKNRRNKDRQRRRLRAILLEYKERPCADCGRTFHTWVMEFDHREGSVKESAVANLVSKGCTNARLLEEIRKCEVVCANCHRMRTYIRLRKASAKVR